VVLGLLVATMASLPFALRQPRTIVVPDAPSCPKCSIELAKVVTLGKSGDSISPDLFATVARSSKNRYFVAPIDAPGAIGIYDQRGTFTGTIGRSGQGPGEFREIAILKMDHADSLYVFDPANSRVTVYTPELRIARIVRIPFAGVVDFAPLPKGEIVVSAGNRTADMIGVAFHIVSADGLRIRSFGSSAAPVGPRDVLERRRIAASPRGELLATAENRYDLEQWSASGTNTLVLQRRPDWFPPRRTGATVNILEERPVPIVTGAWEAPNGLMWARIDVAAPDWKGTWKPGDPESSISTTDYARLADTVLEVIDPRTGRVVTSRRVDVPLKRFFGDGFTFSHREDSLGYRSIDVWALRVTGLPGESR
jgi:hypothetical protein